MITIERMTQHIYPDKWEELEALDKKYNALEKKYGFPPKKRYQCVFGGHASGTLIIERQWESMAKMEEVYEKIMADPEHQKLGQEGISIIKKTQMELYTPLP
jgi:hypothetical protein